MCFRPAQVIIEKVCPECGKKNSVIAKQCVDCGAQLPDDTSAIANATEVGEAAVGQAIPPIRKIPPISKAPATPSPISKTPTIPSSIPKAPATPPSPPIPKDLG